MPVALGQVSRNIYDAAGALLQNKQIETQERIARAAQRGANQRAALGAAQSALGAANANNERAKDRQLQQQRDAEQRRLQQEYQRKSRLQQLLEAINKENERWLREVDRMRQRGFMHNPGQQAEIDAIDRKHDEFVDLINEKISRGDMAAAEAIAMQLQNEQKKRWKYAPRTEIPPEFKEVDGQKLMRDAQGNWEPIRNFAQDAAAKIERDNQAHADRQATIRASITKTASDVFQRAYSTGTDYNTAADLEDKHLQSNGLPPTGMPRKSAGDPGYYMNDPNKLSQSEKRLEKDTDYLRTRRDHIMDDLRKSEGNPSTGKPWTAGEKDKEFQKIWKEGGYEALEQRVQAERASQAGVNQQGNPGASAGDGIPQDVLEAKAWMDNVNARLASGWKSPDPQGLLKSMKEANAILKGYESQSPGRLSSLPSQRGAQAAPPSVAAPPQRGAVPQQVPPPPAPQAAQPPAQQADPDERAPGPFQGKIIGRETSSISSGGLGGLAVMGDPVSGMILNRLDQPRNEATSKSPDLAPRMGRTGQGQDDPRMISKRDFDRLVNETKKEVTAERTEAANPISGLVSSERKGLAGLPVDDAAITAEATRRVKSEGYNFVPPTGGEKHFNEKMAEFSERYPEPPSAIWRRSGEAATRNLGAKYGNDQVVKNPAWEQWDQTRKQVADIARKEADKIEQKFQDWKKQQHAKSALWRSQRAGTPQNVGITLSPFAFVNEKTLRERTLKELYDALPKAIEQQKQESSEGGRYRPGEGTNLGTTGDQERLRRDLNKLMDRLENGDKLTWQNFKDLASRAAGMMSQGSLSSEISDLGNWSKYQAPWSRPDNLSSDGWDKLQQKLGKTGDFDSSQDLGKFLSAHYDKPGASQFGPSAGNKPAGLDNQDQIKVTESSNGNLSLENVAGKTMEVKNPEMDGVVTLFMVSGNGELPKKPERNADEALLDAKAKSIDLNSSIEDLARTGWLPFDVRPQYENYPDWVDKLPAAKWIGKDGQEVRKNGISTTAKGIGELVDEASKSMELGKYSPEAKAAEKATQEGEQPAAEGDPNADQVPVSASLLSPEMQEHHLRTPKPPTKEAFEKGLRDNGLQPQPGEYEEYLQARQAVRSAPQVTGGKDGTAPGNLFLDKDGALKQSDGKNGKPFGKDQPLPPGYKSLVPQPNQQPFQGQPQQQGQAPQQRQVGPMDIARGAAEARRKQAAEDARNPRQQLLDQMDRQKLEDARNFGQPPPIQKRIAPRPLDRKDFQIPQPGVPAGAGIQGRASFTPPTFEDFSSQGQFPQQSFPSLGLGSYQPDYSNAIASQGFSPQYLPQSQSFQPTYQPQYAQPSFDQPFTSYEAPQYEQPYFQPQFDNYNFQPQFEPVGQPFEYQYAPYIGGNDSFNYGGGDYFYGGGYSDSYGDYSSFV